jgi:hypothetical protein
MYILTCYMLTKLFLTKNDIFCAMCKKDKFWCFNYLSLEIFLSFYIGHNNIGFM